MAILATASIGKDFRITIPREVREFLKLKEGDEVIFFSVARQRGRACLRKSTG